MAILAAAAAGDASGTAIRDNVRRISQREGEKVDNVTDGLLALAAGRAINYEGCSGPRNSTSAATSAARSSATSASR